MTAAGSSLQTLTVVENKEQTKPGCFDFAA